TVYYRNRFLNIFNFRYGEFPELCNILLQYIKKTDNILIIGCGKSTVGMSLYDAGYKNITKIDISYKTDVPDPKKMFTFFDLPLMQYRRKTVRPDLISEYMDATQMTYPDEKFNVVLDKGILDILMPDTEETTIAKIDKYFKEVTRVLRNGGRYVCISLLQEHILRKLLSYFPASNFMFHISRCHDAESKARTEGGSSIPIFMIIATKCSKLQQTVLEVDLVDGRLERLSSIEDMISAVFSTQQLALMLNKLRNSNIVDIGEVSLDLQLPGDEHPRYTVYVIDRPCTYCESTFAAYIDRPSTHCERMFAAYIVPQGKETDWLYSTKEGRQEAVKQTGRNRLAIVTLRREHTFKSLFSVKQELAACMSSLAPDFYKELGIPVLILGDIGTRTIWYQGESNISGPFVVEDVKDYEVRRLIFLNNPYVIQSEARLKEAKGRRGRTRKIADLEFLAREYHGYMVGYVNAVIDTEAEDEILVLGLGGGGLCMYLHRCFPKLRITAVEIDYAILTVAKRCFNFVTNDRVKVEIADGIQFVKDAATNGKKYKAILCDMDNKDSSFGMSFPPKEFLEISVLRAVAASLTQDGLFILNLGSTDMSLKEKATDDLESVFESILEYNLNSANAVVVCSAEKYNIKEWRNKFKNAIVDFDKLAIARKLSFSINIARILKSL
ncbi:methyltransferase-like protein 13, partial [Ooceraea biroi]|uniref:methyltransferase-like protein 13 n=1 Tax=Ooceraea biroi TaxID=2015173 RepID=UPI000F082653